MNIIKTTAIIAGIMSITACSTTTMRSIQEMESNNDQLFIKYGEVVYQKDLFSSQIISNKQSIAECEKSNQNLACKSLNVTIDGSPLVSVKNNAPF
jgi:hypothetical protein